MPDIINKLAAEIEKGNEIPPAHIRFGKVTEIEAVTPFRIRTSLTESLWVVRDIDTPFAIGDRAWLIQQGALCFAWGRY